MSRDLSNDNLNAVTADVFCDVLFAELDFPSGVVRAHNALGTITWGGHEWLGLGTFGTVRGIEEDSTLARKTVTYTLSGIPNDMISLAMNDYYQGRPAKVYLGFLNRTTGQLVDDPILLDQGRLDVPETEEGETVSISITAESRMSQWERPRARRYTNADQQSRFAGDRGMEFVSQAAQKEINWGRPA
jgi:hypothetical protein